MNIPRAFVYLGAIACWLVLWLAMMLLGLELGKAMVGPKGEQGYLAVTGLSAIFVIPVGLACAAFVLWWTRHVFLFLVSAIPIGLAVTLWPFLFFWAGD